MERNFGIWTFGCQMNVRDSEIIRAKLKRLGFIETEPEKAKFVVINTCSVRKKADNKARVYIKENKRKGKKVIVAGCVAQQEKGNLLKLGADLVVGTRSFVEIDKFLEEFERNPVPRSWVDYTPREVFSDIEPENTGKSSAFVTIILGCDKFCTFCVVPYTRGREISRPPEDIIKEVKGLVEQGVKEITLIGQNVNSYRHNGTDFKDLLKFLEREIPEYFWLNFTSPHPKDFNRDVIEIVKNSNKICEWFHLPLQSGSTRILKNMRRGYTQGEYLELVSLIRENFREPTITTDIIVGYPGETDEDFEETLKVVREVRFDMAFMFKYSPRPHTPASHFENQILENVKEERLQKLIKEVNCSIVRNRREMIGKKYEILIQEKNKKNPDFSDGKTKNNIKVIVKEKLPKGTLMSGIVESVQGHTPLVKFLRILN